MDEVVEGLRWLNALLSGTGLLWLCLRSYMRRNDYPYSILLILLTLSFYVFSVLYSSVEQAIQNAEPGLRTLMSFTSNIALLVTLALTQEKRRVRVASADVGGGPRRG